MVVLYASDDEAENRQTAAEAAEWMNVRIVNMTDAPFSRGVALTA